MTLFAELKRRNVLRVAAAYLVAAWLLVQVSATLFPVFGFSPAAVRITVILFAVGFIPALILAWVFEITPEGLKRESPGWVGTQYNIGEALLRKGELDAALSAMQQESSENWRLMGLPLVYHALGRKAESDSALAELIDKHERDSAYNIAYVLAFRGEIDSAFEWLDKAVAYHDTGLVEIMTDPMFANLYDDPRWLRFLQRIGKAPEQMAAIRFEVTLPE